MLAPLTMQAAGAETVPLPQAKPGIAASTDKPIATPLPQPATTAPLPSADAINPDRFGAKPSDSAYGAFQRGLYKT
ncbi:MAG: sel1 repeat family protein, partial [Mesorhizobium sp.]